jgi:hypothetical protein
LIPNELIADEKLNSPVNIKQEKCCITFKMKWESSDSLDAFVCLSNVKNKCEYETLLIYKKLMVDCSRLKNAKIFGKLVEENDATAKKMIKHFSANIGNYNISENRDESFYLTPK